MFMLQIQDVSVMNQKHKSLIYCVFDNGCSDTKEVQMH